MRDKMATEMVCDKCFRVIKEGDNYYLVAFRIKGQSGQHSKQYCNFCLKLIEENEDQK